MINIEKVPIICMDTEVLIKKTLFNLVIYGLYYNGVFYFIRPDIYQNIYYVTYLAIFYLAEIIDTYLRPLDTEEEEENYAKFIVFIFLINPFLFVLVLIERDLLYGELVDFISILGLVIYAIAAIIVLLSRIHLGRQATGTLVIIEDHELITTGIYRIVRHPMYAGTILGVFGFVLVVQSVFVGSITIAMYFWVFNNREKYEENLLIQQFGQDYRDYMGHSYRLIPLVW